MFSSLETGASGLNAQRVRMDTLSNNLLNMNSTRNARGEVEPYQRRFVVFAPGQKGAPEKPGVHVAQIGLDRAPFRQVYDPGHQDANAEGYVTMPNVNMAVEFTNMLEASRAYEANITMMETTKQMLSSTLRLLA
jgi:flagellar basal-body rod protein FlgC